MDYMHDTKVFHMGSLSHHGLLQTIVFPPTVVLTNNKQFQNEAKV